MQKILLILIFLFVSFEVKSRVDWIQKDICSEKKDEVSECKDIGKDLFLYNKFVKKELLLGKIEGVIYFKKGENRGTNQKIETKVSGYYYLINDSGDISNLFTKWSKDPNVTVK